jgi:hypothetical protein
MVGESLAAPQFLPPPGATLRISSLVETVLRMLNVTQTVAASLTFHD